MYALVFADLSTCQCMTEASWAHVSCTCVNSPSSFMLLQVLTTTLSVLDTVGQPVASIHIKEVGTEVSVDGGNMSVSTQLGDLQVGSPCLTTCLHTCSLGEATCMSFTVTPCS